MADITQLLAGAVQWVASSSATNAAVAAIKAPNTSTEVNLRHFIYGFTLSAVSGTITPGNVQLLDGATVLDTFDIPAGFSGVLLFDYKHPLPCSVGNSAILNVAALGSGVVVRATIRGRTLGT